MSDSVFFLLPTNKLYKKEDTRRLKNFPAGYVGNIYRNLADNINTDSDFYSRIAANANISKEDVQKYLLATSDIAKSIQTDINHYVTRDRINNASFRKKLDTISKNILRRQNPLKLVFKDISTYDAKNPIVESLLKETDIKKSSLIVILLDLCRAILVKGWKFKKGLIGSKAKPTILIMIIIMLVVVVMQEEQIII